MASTSGVSDDEFHFHSGATHPLSGQDERSSSTFEFQDETLADSQASNELAFNTSTPGTTHLEPLSDSSEATIGGLNADVSLERPVLNDAVEEHAPRPAANRFRCSFLSVSLCVSVRDKSVVALTATQTALSIADGVTTAQFVRRGFVEVDPISRILIGRRPTWARMAPIGAAQIMASVWLAGRMRNSSHTWVRRLWWTPQVLEIGLSVFGTVNNLGLRR